MLQYLWGGFIFNTAFSDLLLGKSYKISLFLINIYIEVECESFFHFCILQSSLSYQVYLTYSEYRKRTFVRCFLVNKIPRVLFLVVRCVG